MINDINVYVSDILLWHWDSKIKMAVAKPEIILTCRHNLIGKIYFDEAENQMVDNAQSPKGN